MHTHNVMYLQQVEVNIHILSIFPARVENQDHTWASTKSDFSLCLLSHKCLLIFLSLNPRALQCLSKQASIFMPPVLFSFFNYLFERGRETGRIPLQQCSILYLKKPHKLQVFTSLLPCTTTMTVHLLGQTIILVYSKSLRTTLHHHVLCH